MSAIDLVTSATASPTVTPAFVQALQSRLGPQQLLHSMAERIAYASDNSRREGIPELVVLAASHDDVVHTAALCHEHRVPLTARGRGSNTTGACIAAHGGVVISFERMQRIIELRPADRVAVVEPGVLNADLQRALLPHRLFWAPDPTSSAYSSIGGNLACNAGGPRTVKYGAARDNLLALRAVDGQGRGFRCGVAVSKNSTGFDLARLLVGSEGTLALITEASLMLTPAPAARRGMRALFDSVAHAAEAVSRLMGQPEIPAALEFMDAAALALVRRQGVDVDARAQALLLIDADGDSEGLPRSVELMRRAAAGAGLVEWREAADAGELEQLWAARRALSPALRSLAPDKINEDVVVPVSRLPELVGRVQALAQQHALQVVCFGHAGNGNLHVNLLYDGAEPAQARAAGQCLDAVFAAVLALGGTLSGEHGIGVAKRAFMRDALDPVTLELMRTVKAGFDPRGILNPGKLLP